MLAEQAFVVAENAERFAARVEDLLAGLNEERRKREAADARADKAEKLLAIREAEFAKFNGHNWPAELEKEKERTQKAQQVAHDARAELAKFETLLSALKALSK